MKQPAQLLLVCPAGQTPGLLGQGCGSPQQSSKTGCAALPWLLQGMGLYGHKASGQGL